MDGELFNKLAFLHRYLFLPDYEARVKNVCVCMCVSHSVLDASSIRLHGDSAVSRWKE